MIKASTIALLMSSFLLTISANGQGSLEKVAVSLHDGWFVQSAANTTATGAAISTPGFSTSGWLKTNIPATPVGAQVGNGVYPSPYVGTNAQQIPGWPAAGTNFANSAWPSGSPYSAHWWFLNNYRLKAVGWCATESRGARLKPSEALPAQSRLKARWAR